jgi:hypothetical protein
MFRIVLVHKAQILSPWTEKFDQNDIIFLGTREKKLFFIFKIWDHSFFNLIHAWVVIGGITNYIFPRPIIAIILNTIHVFLQEQGGKHFHGKILGVKLPEGVDSGHVNEWIQVINCWNFKFMSNYLWHKRKIY